VAALPEEMGFVEFPCESVQCCQTRLTANGSILHVRSQQHSAVYLMPAVLMGNTASDELEVRNSTCCRRV